MLRLVMISIAAVLVSATAALLIDFATSSNSVGSLKVSAKDGPQPKAVVDGDTVHDFGKMPQRTTGKHSWTFRNDGKGELEIWLGGTTCKCTVAKLAELKESGQTVKLKPGESTSIDLEWESKEMEGTFSQEAKIHTNDPERPMIPLIAKGIIHPVIVVLPKERSLAMSSVSSDDPKKMKVLLFAPDQPDLKLLKIATSKPDLIVVTPAPLTPEELKPLEVKGGYKLEVEVKPGMPLGTFRDEIIIGTDSELEPEVRLTVTGNVTGPISVLPERLRLINVTSRQGGAGEVTLLVRGGKPTKFEVARKPEKVQVDIAPSETATLKGRYRMTVTVPPGTPSGQIEETIILKTDNPNAAELRIPLNIFVLGGAAG